MTELAVSPGLDTDAVLRSLDAALDLVFVDDPLSLRGLLIAPDNTDPTLPIAAVDMVYTTKDAYPPEQARAVYSPGYNGDDVYIRTLYDDAPRAPYYIGLSEEKKPQNSTAQDDAAHESTLALGALADAVRQCAYPLAGVWYARSTQPDVFTDTGKFDGFASQSSLHIQVAGTPAERQGFAILEAFQTKVDAGIAHKPLYPDKDVGRYYQLTLGFGVLAATRRDFMDQGTNTIPRPVIDMEWSYT